MIVVTISHLSLFTIDSAGDIYILTSHAPTVPRTDLSLDSCPLPAWGIFNNIQKEVHLSVLKKEFEVG